MLWVVAKYVKCKRDLVIHSILSCRILALMEELVVEILHKLLVRASLPSGLKARVNHIVEPPSKDELTLDEVHKSSELSKL